MPTLLSRAISLAVAAHAPYQDPPGQPYILHPLRILQAVSQPDDAHQHPHLQCVAILHDALERTKLSAADLRRARMPAAVIRAVQLLTHDKSAPYADYIIRLKPNALARAVKLADLLDNADLRRVTFRADKLKKDVPRLIRYAASYQYLTDQIDRKTFCRIMSQTQ